MQKKLIIVICALFLVSCGGDDSIKAPDDRTLSSVNPEDRNDYYSGPPDLIIDTAKKYTAIMHTRKGDIKIALDAGNAPLHTNNFVFLAEQGFYDGLTFHRKEDFFVLQGGDPLANSSGGPGYKIPAEIGLLHEQGVIAAARVGDTENPNRDSSGSQFYFTLFPQPGLNGAYSVFGKIVDGYDAMERQSVGDKMIWVEIVEE
jgi:peptidyl-prolyl cis-trans isomerase B (cyclophilin B)